MEGCCACLVGVFGLDGFTAFRGGGGGGGLLLRSAWVAATSTTFTFFSIDAVGGGTLGGFSSINETKE